MNDDNERIYNEVSGFLHDIISPLSAFLGSILPVLGSDWWKVAVVNSLSYQQSKRLEQRNITTLSGLDLAGLLRVLDQNWYHISVNLNLPQESRHYVKEMMTIRNRWAHVVADGFKPDDVYRDLDTLQRFAQVIQSDSHLLKRINEAKKDIIANNCQHRFKTSAFHRSFISAFYGVWDYNPRESTTPDFILSFIRYESPLRESTCA